MILDDPLQVAFASWGLAGKQIMVDEVGGQKFFEGVEISLTLRFVEAAYKGLVLFFDLRRHRSFLLTYQPAFLPATTTPFMMPPGGSWHIGWRLIHPSAWNSNSANFAVTEF